MSILKWNAFTRTFKGRTSIILLALAVLNLNSCTVYTSSETSMEYVRNTEQIQNNKSVYKFYVHDAYGSYLMQDPVFHEDGSVSGKLIAVNYQKPDSTWSATERKAYWADHKYDIGIYTKNTVSDLRADLTGPEMSSANQTVTISTDEIEKMTITSIDKEGELGSVALVLLIVLGILVVIGLLIVIISAVAVASSDGANSSSDGSSDGSGSNSNSDSGSGGGGSGSSG